MLKLINDFNTNNYITNKSKVNLKTFIVKFIKVRVDYI